jgi:SSS family solute:Na+ symporter
MALVRAGGWEAIVAAAPADPEYLDFWAASGVVLAALIVPAFIVSPGLLQKAYASENERALRLGVGAQGLVLLVFALAPPLLGMIARVYAPALGQPELAVPTVLTLGLPTALGALGLAAVFSAEVSTADTVLFMLSTSLSKDMYKRFLAPEASDERVLRVARGAAVAGGALGVVLAIVIPSVIASLTAFYAVLGVSLFVPVVAGLHTRRPGVPEALAAVGGGVAALLAARFAALAELSPLLDPTLVGIVTSGLAFGAVFVARVRWRPDSIRA